MDEFFNYCCRDYSVWENTQTRARSVVVGKFGTAGLGWILLKTDLCCEEAEALSGISMLAVALEIYNAGPGATLRGMHKPSGQSAFAIPDWYGMQTRQPVFPMCRIAPIYMPIRKRFGTM